MIPNLPPSPGLIDSTIRPRERRNRDLLTGLLGCIAVLTTVGIAVQAHAATPREKAHWTTTVMQSAQDLPDPRVTGLVQTADGYLWVATRGGLLRYNGSTFESFSPTTVPGVLGNGVRAMFADASGALWLGANRNTVIRLTGERAVLVSDGNRLPGPEFSALAEGEHNDLWLGFGSQVYRYSEGTLHPLSLPPELNREGVASLTRTNDGAVWCAIGGRFGVLRKDGLEFRHDLGSRDLLLASGREGGVWACSERELWQVNSRAELRKVTTLPDRVSPRALLEDSTGAVWIGTLDNGLFRFANGQLENVTTSHGHISSLLEDHEGTIWAGTLGGGLNRLRPKALTLTDTSTGLPFTSLISVSEDSTGSLWIVGQAGGVARGDGAAWRQVAQDLLGRANCVATASDGKVWIGTRDRGLHQWDIRTEKIRTWTQKEGLASNAIRSLHVASDGVLWFTTDAPNRLGKLADNQVEMLPSPSPTRVLRALTEDIHGAIWVGTSEGKIFKVERGARVMEPTLEDLPERSIRCLHAAADGRLWIGYASHGLAQVKDGRIGWLTTNNGLRVNSIFQIASAIDGSVWCAGVPGVSRITVETDPLDSSRTGANLRVTYFGLDEGRLAPLPNYGNTPAVWSRSDGSLVFATNSGLLTVHPKQVRDNPRPPSVYVEQVMLDEQVIARRDSQFPLRTGKARQAKDISFTTPRLIIPPDHRQVQITYAALSFAAPENVRFRYRLEGSEDAWSEPVAERSVRYPRLPAGRYTFRVSAANETGVWNTEGATLELQVTPFLWQRWWFRAGLIIGFTTLVTLIVRAISFRRLRGKLHKAEQQTAVLRERERIARDIHDDLGGSLSHIKLLSELATLERDQPEQTHVRLNQITAATQETLKALDEIVWAVNPRGDTLPNLIDYLGQHAVTFLRAAGIRCEVDLPPAPPAHPVSSEVRHHVYLAVKEVLTNIVRHSGAQKVDFRITLDRGRMHVLISDNGCGMGTPTTDPQSDGIRNITQRMSAIGGTARIETAVDRGTEIDLELPLQTPDSA